MEFSQEEFEEILNIFSDESDEIIRRLTNNILSLEKTSESKEIIVELFRDAHSLKGAARMIGFNDIQAIAHKIEDILGLARDGKMGINSEVTDVLYRSVDFINMDIQLSIKNKKEVKLKEYTKFMTQLDNIVKNPPTTTDAAGVNEEKPSEDLDSDEGFVYNLKKEFKDINAKIVEIHYLLNKIEENADLNYVLALMYDVDLIKNNFVMSKDTELKALLQDISLKLEFVSQNTGVLTSDELKIIKEKFIQITAKIKEIFESLGIEVFNYEELADEKLNGPDNAQQQEVKGDNKSVFDAQGLSENILKLSDSPDIADSIIEVVNSLISEYQNTDVELVFKKVLNILNLVKSQQLRPDNETLNLLKQSISLVEKLINDTQPADKEDISLLLQSLDITEQMIGLKKEENLFEAPAKAFKQHTNGGQTDLSVKSQDVFQIFEQTAIKTLRVDTQKLDKLVNQIAEVIISKIKTQKHILELEEINAKLSDIRDFSNKIQNYLRYYDRKLSAPDKVPDIAAFANFNKQVLSYLSESQLMLNEEIQDIAKLHKHMQEDDAKLNLVVNKLEQMVKDIRLLPLATVFHIIPRMVRDIAKDKGKVVNLSIVGNETNADKKIIEEIKLPLMHIIRNAVDHGIETPEERVAAGKAPEGRVQLYAKHKDNKIVIEITDDGRGVNLEKIRQKAITRELLTFDEINAMNDEQLMNLIFWPGFTTEDTVTELSGRGVGLDIVQTKISQLNGKVKVQSIVGQGTKVTIELPVTMATIKSFVVRINSQSFAVPVSAIKAVVKVHRDDIFTKDGKANILYHDTSVPVFNMADTLGFERNNEPRTQKIVLLIEAENNIVGFSVDELVGDQEILTKELAPPLFKINNISGITTLVNGEICLIINVSELLKTVISADYKQIGISKTLLLDTDYVPSEYRILVVDDFMTTRIMLKNILNAKGYNVDVAHDALEGLVFVGHNNYNLIISDVEMPKMSGYEFSKRVKTSDATANTPLILISSVSPEENKESVKQSGADMFISKNEFNQEFFLKSVEYLIKKGLSNA